MKTGLGGLGNAEAKACLAEHQGLVMWLARRFAPRGRPVDSRCEFEDFISLGQIALLSAYATFDPTKGAKFSTWAARLIGQTMRLTANRERAQTQNEAVVVSEELGLRKATRVVSDRTRERALETLTWRRVSLDTPLQPGHREPRVAFVADPRGADPEEATATQGKQRWLREVIPTKLNEMERFVIEGVLFRFRSDADLARDLGLSRQRIEQVRSRATRKLHRAAKSAGWAAA